jgi:hypothetical protein
MPFPSLQTWVVYTTFPVELIETESDHPAANSYAEVVVRRRSRRMSVILCSDGQSSRGGGSLQYSPDIHSPQFGWPRTMSTSVHWLGGILRLEDIAQRFIEENQIQSFAQCGTAEPEQPFFAILSEVYCNSQIDRATWVMFHRSCFPVIRSLKGVAPC